MVECLFTIQVVAGSNPVAVTSISDIAPASSNEFFDIYANYAVWIHSETCTVHDNNIQEIIIVFNRITLIELKTELQIHKAYTLRLKCYF